MCADCGCGGNGTVRTVNGGLPNLTSPIGATATAAPMNYAELPKRRISPIGWLIIAILIGVALGKGGR